MIYPTPWRKPIPPDLINEAILERRLRERDQRRDDLKLRISASPGGSDFLRRMSKLERMR